MNKVPTARKLLKRARNYYLLRNKLIHERATVGIADGDIENYRRVIEEILEVLFGLDVKE